MTLTIKQGLTLFYWLALGVMFQTIEPTTLVWIGFAGAIGLGLFVTIAWIVSPILATRVYRERVEAMKERIAALDARVGTLEDKLDLSLQQNEELRRQNEEMRIANAQYARDMEAALTQIRSLSKENNDLREQRGEITDC